MTHPFKEYLGDSVYVEVETGMVKLTTNNGHPDDPRNIIYLEPEVFTALTNWYTRVTAHVAAESEAK